MLKQSFLNMEGFNQYIFLSDAPTIVASQPHGTAMEMTIAEIELTNRKNTVKAKRKLAMEIYLLATMETVCPEFIFVMVTMIGKYN